MSSMTPTLQLRWRCVRRRWRQYWGDVSSPLHYLLNIVREATRSESDHRSLVTQCIGCHARWWWSFSRSWRITASITLTPFGRCKSIARLSSTPLRRHLALRSSKLAGWRTQSTMIGFVISASMWFRRRLAPLRMCSGLLHISTRGRIECPNIRKYCQFETRTRFPNADFHYSKPVWISNFEFMNFEFCALMSLVSVLPSRKEGIYSTFKAWQR